MKLELAILAGAESKAFLAGLTKQLDRMEKLAAQAGVMTKAQATEEPSEESSDEDFAPAKTAKAAAAIAAFDSEEEEDDGDFTAPAPAPAAKEKKPPKKKALTVDDVNEACKARAAGGKRKEVLAILSKKFDTTSVSELAPEQYEEAIAAMRV